MDTLLVFAEVAMGKLDKKFVSSLTYENIQQTFDDLKRFKTDIISNEVWMARGCDGINHEEFQENIKHHSAIICEKGVSGKYRFAPFREIKTPKPPYHNLEEASAAGTKEKPDKYIRTLSISTIQDTIFQKLLAEVISPHAETIFANNIDQYSYGYRTGKSSKMCVKKIHRLINEGYLYILDADISEFFDKIEHKLLSEKMLLLFGQENELIQKFLYRFIHVDRISAEKVKDYIYPTRGERREKGIPQGGVLSGLLANVFLYDFDLYVVNKLMPKFEFKYFRYADDFVLLFKNKDWIAEVHTLLKKRLRDTENLVLHPIGEKSKILDLSESGRDSLDFLGFGISSRYLKVKEDNFKKFEKRIVATIRNIEVESSDVYFSRIIPAINRKIVGLEELVEQNDGLCPSCERLVKKRSWIGYFMMMNDVRQLRNIDTMIRTEIYRDYHRRFKIHLRKRALFHATKGWLKSAEKIYYKYKKQIQKYKKRGYCNCDRYFDKDSNLIRVVPNEQPFGNCASDTDEVLL
jgi:retron-type reverse transcriptase